MFNTKNKDKQYQKGGKSASKNNKNPKTSSGAKNLNGDNKHYFSFLSFLMKLL